MEAISFSDIPRRSSVDQFNLWFDIDRHIVHSQYVTKNADDVVEIIVFFSYTSLSDYDAIKRDPTTNEIKKVLYLLNKKKTIKPDDWYYEATTLERENGRIVPGFLFFQIVQKLLEYHLISYSENESLYYSSFEDDFLEE